MTNDPEMTVERGLVDIGTSRIAFEKIGSGPNLLFVHGWPLDGRTWRNMTPHLDGFTRYVIDLPGFGLSKATDQTELTIAGHTAAVVKFIDEVGFDDVVLVGQDSGGMVCRMVAEQRPHVVRGLSLCGTEVPGVHAPLVRLFKVLSVLPGSKAMFRLNMGNRFLAKLPLILGGTVYDKSFLDGEFRTNVLEPILADDEVMDSAVTMIRQFSFDDIDTLAKVHENLHMPTLLVFGEDDNFFPVEKAREMTSQFAGPVQFETISKCKLLLHEEYPQRFAELTRSFVTERCGCRIEPAG